MKSYLFLDHSYQLDQNHAFHKVLEKAGFTLNSQRVEHPGKIFCRFILVNNFYLEFISIGKNSSEKRNLPGLSFGYSQNLEKQYNKLKVRYKCQFLHKNYDWKNNSTDRLPGWNFITFKKPLLENIYTWITEYEKHPKRTRKSKRRLPKHRNTVHSFHGLHLELTKKSIEKLEKLTLKKAKLIDVKNKLYVIKLITGQLIYATLTKRNLYKSIILNCHSLKKAKQITGKYSEVGQFNNQDCLIIENKKSKNKLKWNIILIENKLPKTKK